MQLKHTVKPQKGNLKSLQKLQNRLIKILYSIKRGESIGNLYKSKKILKIEDLAKCEIMNSVFKVQKIPKAVPILVKENYNKFNIRNEYHINLRNINHFKISPFKKSSSVKESFIEVSESTKIFHFPSTFFKTT